MAEASSVAQVQGLRSAGKAQLCLEACEDASGAAQHVDVLECKAWALACLSRYDDALEVLDAAAQLSLTTQQLLSLQTRRRQLVQCLAFADELDRRREYAARALEPGREWYEQTVAKNMTPSTLLFAYHNRKAVYILDQKPTLGLGSPVRSLDFGNLTESTNGMLFGGRCDQMMDGKVFRKHRAMQVIGAHMDEIMQDYIEEHEGCDELALAEFLKYHQFPLVMGKFPVTEGTTQRASVNQPDARCDVWVAKGAVRPECHTVLKALLDARADTTADFPMPMYQNIIDPNLLVQDNGPQSTWSASLFEVEFSSALDVAVLLQLCVKNSSNRKLPAEAMRSVFQFAPPKRPVAKLMSSVHDLDPAEDALLQLTIEEVFNAAVPLLAELRRPALLLPGPLQVVTKAQRIYLEPGEEYEGVWHYDGKEEEIVAVAIYYYNYSDDLAGGDLEFLDKAPSERVVWDDSLTPNHVRRYYDKAPRCRVPVGEGTLVVFSNYQFIHRVLRMVHKGSSGIASRDFLLFFVVDQRVPLPLTDDIVPADNPFELRDRLLHDQLQPAGEFGISGKYVYSTGNGSVAHLGWLNNRNDGNDWADELIEDMFGNNQTMEQLASFAACPPTGRGLSWVFEKSPDEMYNPGSKFLELRRHEEPDQSSKYVACYLNVDTQEVQAEFPAEGVRGIVHQLPDEI